MQTRTRSVTFHCAMTFSTASDETADEFLKQWTDRASKTLAYGLTDVPATVNLEISHQIPDAPTAEPATR